jgi:hypothetical protein
MNYVKSIFQAAIVAGGLALGSAASQAMPLAQSPAPAQTDAATALNGVTEVAYSARYCYRHPRACGYYRNRYYRHRYYRPYYYPRYYGYRPYYGYPGYGYYGGYPYYGYGYYGRPRIGFWWGF